MRNDDAGSPMRTRLTDERRVRLIASIKRFYEDAFDETLSDFRTAELLDFFVAGLGPVVYNQGVQDARGYLQERLDDLEGEVYEPERARRPG